MAMENMVQVGLYRSISLVGGHLHLSHILYADDTIFLVNGIRNISLI